jgi:DNA-binding PadR family transcriptional regulator
MQLPLGPADLHVLLALSREPAHGLGIAEDIESLTDGAVVLGPATLYRTLKELVAKGLVRRLSSPPDEADPRRKYYELTAEGARHLRQQLAVASRVAEVGQERLRRLGDLPGMAFV